MASLPLIARCERCGRGFVKLGEQSNDIDRYPPEGWRPERSWTGWLGINDPEYPPPECGGRIINIAHPDSAEGDTEKTDG